ncbi:leucine-rich repeat protein 1 [Venturia canescens]|uniref:leucine-rich repeat protein 1 n=1 Tax=Venturia canescens TaxID=32260 RepID=UPI001C9C0F47|nr:leucine-rich repeat protein 1 [Venturia canescens]
MKLMCNVEVHCRLLTTINIRSRKKGQRGCLTIARPTVKNNELVLFLQTMTNKLGTKYKIDDNIEKIFTKFVNDGKATIRLKEPPHDLIIQSDVVQLKSFLHVLKLGLLKKLDPAVLSVSNMNPKTFTTQKTKVVITKKADYPVLEGFPRTTEILHLAKLERKSFDRQILRLQSLKILDLSENQLSSLPNELGTLPNLTELHLASNRLKFDLSSKSTWLDGTNIRKNLKLLDISSNEISHLPSQIGRLRSLVTLKMTDNLLRTLPQSMGNLMSLKFLNVKRNLLDCLPGSMLNLHVEDFNLSSNPFGWQPRLNENHIEGVPKLTEIAARSVVNLRISYDSSTVPLTLVEYLDGAKFCPCGKACFESYVRRLMEMNVHQVAAAVTSSLNSSYTHFDMYFCCGNCVRRYTPR